MAGSSELCALLDSSLIRYADPDNSVGRILTPEEEKDLLLFLSSIRRHFRASAEEPNCDSKLDPLKSSILGFNFILKLEQPTEDNHSCLAHVVSLLVAVLNLKNRFVQHIAEKVLIELSCFLFQCDIKWEDYVRMLWLSVHASMSHMPFSTEVRSGTSILEFSTQEFRPIVSVTSGSGDSSSDVKIYCLLLQSRLMSISWSTAANLLGVLRSILKWLKHEGNNLEVYVELAVSFIGKLPWDLLSEIHAQLATRKVVLPHSSKDHSLNNYSSLACSEDALLAAILQLFCSLIDAIDSEDMESFLDVLDIYSRFADLVPKIMSCCFSEKMKSKQNYILRYFLHKALVLMKRLSFHFHWKNQYPVIWLQLVKLYFGNLLYNPLLDFDCDKENVLEGSPFFLSTSDGEFGACSRHLQIRAIFLLFKCSFTITRTHIEAGQKCICKEVTLALPCVSRLWNEKTICLGLESYYEWLRRCAFLHSESCSISCSDISMAFLQLFVEEDDMLFEMLLQLLERQRNTLPVQNFFKDQEGDSEALLHLAHIFDPIRLFNMFLFLLHYDHLVLMDYLISKDTGILCLRYLLRLTMFQACYEG